MEHPLETIIKGSVAELKELADVGTVVGRPVYAGNAAILPVSKVTMGFVSGGAEYGTKQPILSSGSALDTGRNYPFAGTLTAGFGVMPTAFLVVRGESVSVLPAAEDGSLAARLTELMPEILNGVKKLFDGAENE